MRKTLAFEMSEVYVANRKCTGRTSNKMIFNYEPKLFPQGRYGFSED